MNGLATGVPFTIKLQNMSSTGSLSTVAMKTANTVAEKPIANAAYFDNFDEDTDGPLNSNYYDVSRVARNLQRYREHPRC